MSGFDPASPTDEGQRLMNEWLAATTELERAKAAVNRAECAVANTLNALGKWMMPEDALIGETIGVWHGDNMFAVKRLNENSYSVKVRTRGKRGLYPR